MTVTDVNQLVQRFEQAAMLMLSVAKGGVPQVPGMGPVPGAGYRGKPQQKKKQGSKSGNPAKRAAENAAFAAGAKAPKTGGGSGFGLGGGANGGPTEDELAAVQKLLGR